MVSTPTKKRTTLLRRLAAASAVLALPLTATAIAPAAHADDNATLTVVGTSDVYDSFLVQTILKPQFEAAYPQYTLNYVSRGTGAAIAYAKSGAASAMIVHAAALENQFVDEGYSLESYGRAIFWGDYILGGPAADPAGITSAGHGNDIVRTFQDIATAGAAGTATFVSRGGTPGTTVQEHAIWAETTGVPLCTISASDGGGKAPTTGNGACGTVADLPDWYKRTDLTQAPNILAASTCNFSPRPANSCYVFTDRGTFNYLQSTAQATNLTILTRDNAPNAIGGPDLLVNSFHAYAINPAKFTANPGVSINTAAATAFLNWVTSPAGQTAVGGYLNDTGDAPFLPSAAPAVTTSTVPASLVSGQTLKVTGTLRNVVPGTPKLDFVPVKLVGTPTGGGAATTVATATTDATGAFTLTYKPTASMRYAVVTDQITKIENTTLDPIFGDLLAPTETSLGTVNVTAAPLAKGTVTAKAAKAGAKTRFHGKLTPAAGSAKAKVVVYVKVAGAKKFRALTTVALRKGAKTWSTKVRVKGKRFTYYVKYTNPGTSTPATSPKKRTAR